MPVLAKDRLFALDYPLLNIRIFLEDERQTGKVKHVTSFIMISGFMQ